VVIARKAPLERKPVKRSKTNVTTKADVLFSRLVRDRDHMCVRCGSPNNLQCAHIWSRRYRALRWRFENAITLCQGCHLYFTLRPAEWAEWCEERVFSELGPAGSYVTGYKTFVIKGDREWPAFSYDDLRRRALNDPPEKAVAALARLKGIG
jgi:hypothetical protein